MIGRLKILFGLIELRANWINITMNKLFAWPLPLITLGNGIKFKLSNKRLKNLEVSIITEVWHQLCYNPPFFQIKDSDVVLDVGGNNGYFSIYAATLAKNGKVFVFEPVKKLFEAINNNIILNNINNVKAENVAVAHEEKENDFYIDDNNNGGHSLFNISNMAKTTKVMSINLEKYCQRNGIEKINFLKMDCEGGEYEILLNAGRDFFTKIEKIAMEYHEDIGEFKSDQLITCLQDNDFIAVKSGSYIFALNKNWL